MDVKTNRLHYLDHARGLIILLVVLQHSVQVFTDYTARYTAYVRMSVRSEFYDGIFFWTDGFIMQALFLISGLFVLPSLQKRGWLSFTKEKLTRLGLVWVFGVAFLVPPQTYTKYAITHDTGYLYYWLNVFPHEFTTSGFWFIMMLLILTFTTALIWTILPSFIRALGKALGWMCHNPVPGYLIFSLIGAILITGSDLYWGSIFWISPLPIMSVKANLFFSFIFYFIIGLGVRESGVLDDKKFIQSFQNNWFEWAMLALVTSIAFLSINMGYTYSGAFDSNYTLHSLLHNGNYNDALEFIRYDGAWIIARTMMHGFYCAAVTIGLIAILLNFTNKTMQFWTSLGACSYGIYVFHEPIVVLIQYFLRNDDLPLFLFASLAFIVGLGASWLFTDKVMRKLPFTKKIF